MKKREFSAGDALVAVEGKEIEFKKISYSSKQEINVNKSGNNKATSYSTGDVTDECSLEVPMSQLRAWEQQRKQETSKANLLGWKIPIAVTYTNEEFAEVTDIIWVVFKSQGREVGGGADGLGYTCDTTCLGIEFDA